MNTFQGKMVIEVSTLVKTSSEKLMSDEAHKGLTSELFKEIRLLLGAKGYLTGSIGATLKDAGEAEDNDIVLINSNTEEAIKDIHYVYNKANSQTFMID
ncbi:hypothetical protein J2S09_004109 [Bacillus fengqiuensis]|nr:hypothetical protein [Bacillus fengqiuensis]